MERTKITFSPDELHLMQNTDWILTKNSVIDKLITGFGCLSEKMQTEIAVLNLLLPEAVRKSSPKISRGEKYEGLPYIILDYPRIFMPENILAIRTLFWWGHYCSITLHVRGRVQETIAGKIIDSLERLSKNSFFISFTGNEWSHDLASGSYLSLRHISQEELVKEFSEAEFVKLSAKVAITSWDTVEPKLFTLFTELADLLKT